MILESSQLLAIYADFKGHQKPNLVKKNIYIKIMKCKYEGYGHVCGIKFSRYQCSQILPFESSTDRVAISCTNKNKMGTPYTERRFN